MGDIHGMYDEVLEAMKQARFDPERDWLLACGDLVDRGPGSRRALRFLQQPYLKALRGNHEDMFLCLYEEGSPSQEALEFVCSRNGMQWWLDVAEEERQALVQAFRKLPLAMEVQTPRGLVGLVHGEVPLGMDWPTFVRNLEQGDARTVKACLWGRDRVEGNIQDVVPGVGRIFSGHTPQDGCVGRYGNMFVVDTGAFLRHTHPDEARGHLSVAELILQTSPLLSANPKVLSDVALYEAGLEPLLLFGASGAYTPLPA